MKIFSLFIPKWLLRVHFSRTPVFRETSFIYLHKSNLKPTKPEQILPRKVSSSSLTVYYIETDVMKDLSEKNNKKTSRSKEIRAFLIKFHKEEEMNEKCQYMTEKWYF